MLRFFLPERIIALDVLDAIESLTDSPKAFIKQQRSFGSYDEKSGDIVVVSASCMNMYKYYMGRLYKVCPRFIPSEFKKNKII